MNTYLICGLGNPGTKYRFTRHNVGFLTVEKLAFNLNEKISKNMFNSLYGECRISGNKVILMQPQTYMNESGRSLARFKEYFKIEVENIMVICDDINLPHGRLRIRKSGGAGGHNGLKSIISLIGTKEFNRLRIGVGGGELKSTSGHVLGNFSQKEFKIIEESIDDSTLAIEEYIKSGIDSSMNKFNKKQ